MTDEYNPFDSQDDPGAAGGLVCVELEFATLRRFREEMAPYLNYDGFFARSERPLPKGTSVEFKFVMPENFVLAHGTAEVAWTIEQHADPDLLPGMALRFVEVGKQSRAVIDELVDFQIATGGDPFDLSRGLNRAGEIPTDALGGRGRDRSSSFDSMTPTAQDPPMVTEPEPAAVPSVEEVLPDWLSGSSAQDQFNFQNPLDEPGGGSGRQGGFGGSSDGSPDRFDVDMIFEDRSKGSKPIRPEGDSFQQMAASPRPADKPPRDLRLGMIVSAAIVLVAVMVLVWSFWFRKSEDVAGPLPAVAEHETEVGVALITDDVAGETSDVTAEAAAGSEGESPEEAVAGSGTEVDAGATAESGAPESVEPTSQSSSDSSEAPERPGAQLRASRVVDVVAAVRGNATTITIRGDGSFPDTALRVSRLQDPLRLWVRVLNMETYYKPNEIEVGSPEVHRVRIGYHPEDNPPALYVVLDLTDDDVVLLDRTIQGDAIRLTVGRK